MIQEFYCTNTHEYTNFPSCRGKLIIDWSRLQEGIIVYTLLKLYKKANLKHQNQIESYFLRGKVCAHQSGTWKSNLMLDKEQSGQGLFGKLIINNQIGLLKIKKSI